MKQGDFRNIQELIIDAEKLAKTRELSNPVKSDLTPVSLGNIAHEYHEFIFKNKRYPTVILMHPLDGRKFIELMHECFGYCSMPNLMKFQGMQLKRSYDVELGKWEIY
ncbi:hypothetical protein ACFOWM_03575 [Ferruginibacter yonginensis]|uniref:Uncharacterized protein n=1 Tax=Ferruginibacter yonginensis TaxID=1310416 RepID=A0ABV8QSQ4_9BACT